ncbi:hypothetical protein CPC08DRAFT_317388 [Agrocybe pediades]|nr:hypothetical protein CPC08DRAFT_317388 [Agrocybe pediades]
MRGAQSLAADTVEIVQDIEKFYTAHGDVLDNMPDVRDAVARLSKDMQSVYDRCLPILQHANSLERGLRRTLFKIELWRNRKEVESNIRNLREQADKCYRHFTRHIQLGTAVAIGELKGAVSEGFSATTSTVQLWPGKIHPVFTPADSVGYLGRRAPKTRRTGMVLVFRVYRNKCKVLEPLGK